MFITKKRYAKDMQAMQKEIDKAWQIANLHQEIAFEFVVRFNDMGRDISDIEKSKIIREKKILERE